MDMIIVVVVTSIGAVIGLAVISVIIATTIAIIIIVAAVAEIITTVRPAGSPTRTKAPARQRGL